MGKCPKCGEPTVIRSKRPDGTKTWRRHITNDVECLRNQLSAANKRIEELEAALLAAKEGE